MLKDFPFVEGLAAYTCDDLSVEMERVDVLEDCNLSVKCRVCTVEVTLLFEPTLVINTK